MDLGQFSVSLAVKDLPTSREFYEKLGFEAMEAEGDDGVWESYGQNWLILHHEEVVIGLFQGMFENNIMTWNPPDVRAVQKALVDQGVEFMQTAEDGEGPASAMLLDPDGNAILLDQH